MSRINKNLPNYLTASRIVVIPIILVVYGLQEKWSGQFAAFLFILASITDFFDGYLARTWNAQSKLGKFLDPIADKLLIASVIVQMVHLDKAHYIPAIAIICREILVSGLREFLAELNVSVPVTSLAKIKTAVQMTAIIILLLGTTGSGFEYTDYIGQTCLWIAAGLTLFTGYAYFKAAVKHFD